MVKSSIHAALPGSLVMLGFGSIAQGALPLLFRHIDIAPKLEERCLMKFMSLAALALGFQAMPASAQLPPPTPAEKAEAAEIAARNAWQEKVGAYRLCLAQDRIADKYHVGLKSGGKAMPQRTETKPCSDPGPYQTANTESKPLEASESHSPAGTAVAPPSTRPNETETRRGQGE